MLSSTQYAAISHHPAPYAIQSPKRLIALERHKMRMSWSQSLPQIKVGH